MRHFPVSAFLRFCQDDLVEADAPEPLWRSVVGDPEPWRRGRILLVCVAAVKVAAQAVMLATAIRTGALLFGISASIDVLIWWLLFAFIWLGTHWVRWLLGSFSFAFAFFHLVQAFAHGSREAVPLTLLQVMLEVFVGAACFAPSVHFFAIRQREKIRWREKLAAAAIFGLLIASSVFTFLGLIFYTEGVQRDERRDGETVLRRLFVQNDTRFLLDHASAPFFDKYKQRGLSWLLQQQFVQMGELHNFTVTGTTLQTHYSFPATFIHTGVVHGVADTDCGRAQLRVLLVGSPRNWKIDGFSWQCSAR
ncbi:hypothetical protein BH18VER1_BH18VER1_12430 [soil metagenome]